MLSPDELKNYSFSTTLRGYNTTAVDNQIELILSNYRMLYRDRENMEHKLRLTLAALKEAQDKLAAMSRSPREESEEITARAEEEAQQIIADAREYADRLIADADEHVAQQKAAFEAMRSASLRFRDSIYEQYLKHIDALDALSAEIENTPFANEDRLPAELAMEYGITAESPLPAPEVPEAQDEASEETDEDMKVYVPDEDEPETEQGEEEAAEVEAEPEQGEEEVAEVETEAEQGEKEVIEPEQVTEEPAEVAETEETPAEVEEVPEQIEEEPAPEQLEEEPEEAPAEVETEDEESTAEVEQEPAEIAPATAEEPEQVTEEPAEAPVFAETEPQKTARGTFAEMLEQSFAAQVPQEEDDEQIDSEISATLAKLMNDPPVRTGKSETPSAFAQALAAALDNQHKQTAPEQPAEPAPAEDETPASAEDAETSEEQPAEAVFELTDGEDADGDGGETDNPDAPAAPNKTLFDAAAAEQVTNPWNPDEFKFDTLAQELEEAGIVEESDEKPKPQESAPKPNDFSFIEEPPLPPPPKKSLLARLREIAQNDN